MGLKADYILVVDGSKLRRLRLEKVLAQNELAQKAGLSSAALSLLETKGGPARPTTVRAIAEALACDPLAFSNVQEAQA